MLLCYPNIQMITLNDQYINRCQYLNQEMATINDDNEQQHHHHYQHQQQQSNNMNIRTFVKTPTNISNNNNSNNINNNNNNNNNNNKNNNNINHHHHLNNNNNNDNLNNNNNNHLGSSFSLKKDIDTLSNHNHNQSSNNININNNNNTNNTTNNISNIINNNNNNNDDAKSTKSNHLDDPTEMKLKKQALEQRKLELERILNEKSWLLQQLQKTENQILSGGHFDYVSPNELFANLAYQYKHEQLNQQQLTIKTKNLDDNASIAGSIGSNGLRGIGSEAAASAASCLNNDDSSSDSAILRRKNINRDNLLNNNFPTSNTTVTTAATAATASAATTQLNTSNNTTNNRNSEVSNRSSEYDNYPVLANDVNYNSNNNITNISNSNSNLSTISGNLNNGRNINSTAQAQAQQQQQMPIKSALKKRATPTPTPTPGNANYLQLHRQQHLLQQLYQQQQTQAQSQAQSQTHLRNFPAAAASGSSSSPSANHFDAISLYSVNSTNVATLRQQHVAPQQQPIIVQCDKYYLSPTHQSYNDGGFIRSSQNIKQYVSPLNSPKHYEIQQYQQQAKQQQQQQQHILSLQAQRQEQRSPMQHLLIKQQATPQYLHHPQPQAPPQQPQTQSQQQQQQQASQSHIRNLDAISLAPSYISVDSSLENAIHQTRWRSQSHLPTSQIQPQAQQQPQHHLHHQHQHQHQHQQQQQHYAYQQQANNSHHLHHQHSFHHTSLTSPIMIATERDNLKSQSSDMLATSPYYASPVYEPPPPPLPPPIPASSTKPKHLDDISISSMSSDIHKKSKSKQWLESSLDGPIIRSTSTLMDTISSTTSLSSSNSASNPPPTQSQSQNPKSLARDRSKLSSQSMSAAPPRHYSISSGSRDYNSPKTLMQGDGLTAGHTGKLLHDDDNARYNKLSQSTSYLNKMESATSAISAPYLLDTSMDIISAFKYLPPKPSPSASASASNLPTPATSTSTLVFSSANPSTNLLLHRNATNTPQSLSHLQPPPPRPPPLSEKPPPPPPPPLLSPISTSSLNSPTAMNSPLSPDIRIESPKNMTVVQQATFQPYKEVTKPFEMSDFYKYSTKFRQKENTNTGSSNINTSTID